MKFSDEVVLPQALFWCQPTMINNNNYYYQQQLIIVTLSESAAVLIISSISPNTKECSISLQNAVQDNEDIYILILVPLVQLLHYWFFFFWLEDVPDWGTVDNGDVLIYFQCRPM